MSDYAPFPEAELAELAGFHETVASEIPELPTIQSKHIARAKACRDAIACHMALRERFLETETQHRIALASQSEAAD